jgi:predicted Zn finger-like uncharacterized protein
MRVVCPGCDAVYEVPNAVLSGPPRMLRCARCGREWVPEPPVPAVAAEAPEAAAPPPYPEPVPFDEPPELPPERSPLLAASAPLVGRPARRPARAAAIGWAATLVFLVAVLSAAYLWRNAIQTAWPPIQRAYASLGIS